MKIKNLSLKNYLRNRRGAASIEAALGTVVMVAASLLALDLYRLASTQTTITHVAVSLADTVSRTERPPWPDPLALTGARLRQRMTGFVQSLSGLLHAEQFPTANASFVVAAVYKDPGPPATLTVLWRETVTLLGTTTSSLTSCNPANQTNEIKLHTNPVTLPTGFANAMDDREIVIVAAVCVERTITAFPGPAYAHYIVPSRDDDLATRLRMP